MNVYVWHGLPNDEYDGTLSGMSTIVLAHTVEEARALVRAAKTGNEYFADIDHEPSVFPVDVATVVHFHDGGME